MLTVLTLRKGISLCRRPPAGRFPGILISRWGSITCSEISPSNRDGLIRPMCGGRHDPGHGRPKIERGLWRLMIRAPMARRHQFDRNGR